MIEIYFAFSVILLLFYLAFVRPMVQAIEDLESRLSELEDKNKDIENDDD